ncbi:Pfs domain-containing protein [Fusarium mundagurra]|uniref:Pfs domain-containing protein n=1 Tax=Fusarium mundagurra TaxID=1567541 RepID=A0A8H6DPY5_9HYPO|nr:Pfs domain-containing protein [Fusarium mundagurra]
MVRQTTPSSPCSKYSSPDEDEHDSEHSSDDNDSLDSYIKEHYNEFGRAMVGDGKPHSKGRERVRQVLLRRQNLIISPDAVRYAARTWDAEMIDFLLKAWGPKVHLTCGVIEAVLSNKEYGVEVMASLQERGAITTITSSVIVAAYENKQFGRDILMQLLGDPGVSIETEAVVTIAALFDVGVVRIMLSRSGIKITDNALVAAAHNLNGLSILEILFNYKDEVQMLEDVAVAAAGNENTGCKMLQLLIDRAGKIPESERIWESAAGNENHGRQITGILFRHQGTVLATEDVIVAAASNTKTGKLVIDFLFKHVEQIVLTDAMILAASQNRRHTTEIIDMLLNKSANEVQITVHTTPSLVENPTKHIPWMEDARSKMCDAIFYILNGTFKDRVSFTTDAVMQIMAHGTFDLISDLVDSIGDRISINEDMIEAVVGGDEARGVDKIVQRLLERNPSVKITEKTVILAAQADYTGIGILKALFNHDSTLQVPPEAIEKAAGTSFSGRRLVEVLLDQTPTVLITERAVVAAAQDPVESGALFDLFISRSKGEIRLSLPHSHNHLVEFVKRVRTEPREARVSGPPLEEAVQIYDPEIVAHILRNEEKPRQLSVLEAERVVSNSSAGKEITQMLLDHGFQIEISESVVRSAARIDQQGYEIMGLLLRDTEKVRMAPEAVEAIAALMPVEIVRLMFETHQEIRVTTAVLEEAAKHGSKGLAILVEVLGEYPPITDGILQAAASNVSSLRWIYDNYGDDVECTQRAVEIAAGESPAALQLMLEQSGDAVRITTKVMEAVATTYWVRDKVSMLFEMRPDEVCLSDEFWISLAGSENVWPTEEVLEELTGYCNCIRITVDLVTAASKNRDGVSLLRALLRNNKTRVTASGVQAIVRLFDQNMFCLLLEHHGQYIHVTERTLEAAAANHSGWGIVEFIVRTQDKLRSWCTDRVIEAAAQNSQTGRDILELLLHEYPQLRCTILKVLKLVKENVKNY